jgi:hypothetical protein
MRPIFSSGLPPSKQMAVHLLARLVNRQRFKDRLTDLLKRRFLRT